MFADFNELRFLLRDGTSDWNTVTSIITEDEYGVKDYDFRGKIVFDIGAHVGAFAVMAASRGAVDVVALEPIPENVGLIRANAVLNQVDVTVVEGALAFTDTIDVYYGPDEAHEFIGCSEKPTEDLPKITVPGITFEQLCDETMGLPDIVKLDCEGGEWVALASPLLSGVPLIVGEFHGAPGEVGVLEALGETHDIVTTGTSEFGLFFARQR